MGIQGWRPFLTKKGIGTDISKSELKAIVGERPVLVDVLASHFFKMLKLSKIADEEKQRGEIVAYVKKLYIRDLGLDPTKIIFVFDGDLHQAKWDTKAQRIGSSILQQAKMVNYN